MPRWVLVREMTGVALLLVAFGLEVTLLVLLAVSGAWGLFALALGMVAAGALGMLLARWDPAEPPSGGRVLGPGESGAGRGPFRLSRGGPVEDLRDGGRPVRMPRLPDDTP